MNEIDALSDRVNNDRNVDGVRIDITNLIARLLNKKRDTLTYWDKICFGQALSALNSSIDQGRPASTAWLELSLAALRNLLVSADKRAENYQNSVIKTKGGVIKTMSVDGLTFDQIMAEVRRLGGAP